jgi:hypothetical protein
MGTARVPGGPVENRTAPATRQGDNYIRLSGSTRKRMTMQPSGAIVVPSEKPVASHRSPENMTCFRPELSKSCGGALSVCQDCDIDSPSSAIGTAFPSALGPHILSLNAAGLGIRSPTKWADLRHKWPILAHSDWGVCRNDLFAAWRTRGSNCKSD